MAEVMAYVQFAARQGLVTDYDIQGHIHGGLMAAHMPASYHRRYQKRLAELQALRAAGLQRYAEAIARGEVQAPPKKSSREKLEAAAAGHPDLPSTQAAIRTLARLKERERAASASRESTP